MKRKHILLPPLFGAAAVLFLAFSILLAYRPSAPKPPVLRPLSQSVPEDSFRLNVNDASREELDCLPGIGPATADRILTHRTESGPYTGPEDLLAVDGIGPKTLEAIEPYITFE